MKTAVALVAAFVAVSGYLINVPVAPVIQPAFAPSGWIHVQKLIIPLFENVCEGSNNPTIVRQAQEFLKNTSSAEFWDSKCFTNLQQLISSNNLLTKGEIFSEYNPDHINELKIVFSVLKNAKSFDTFYKAASWARQNLNCGLYVDAIYLALENRKDTENLTIPAPYELLPNYFIRKDIIIKGSSLLAGQEIIATEGLRDEGNAYTLDANYTANIYDSDDESKLAYFREDVGINSYYFLHMLNCAPWLNTNVDINSRYGEEMYHWMRQWMSRYNLERYSNGLNELETLTWDSIADIPYDPMLVYSNGNEFNQRTPQMIVERNEDKELLQTIENNLATIVTHMRESGYNKTQVLNHLMEILVTNERSYDFMARHLLGNALNIDRNPSVFEHYMTSLRDPIFWKLNKNMVTLIDNALKVLPPYTKSQLYFPGVEVVNVDIKKMMTNFDNFEFDITDALKIGNGDTTFQVKISQPRLNHKPFTMKVNISSLVTQKGLVKVYLGPKIAPGEFSKKKNLFCLIDSFDVNLKRGSNIITRSSADMTRFSPDFMSLKTLRKNVEDAQFGLDALPLNNIKLQIQFPQRLVLPKGTPEGLPLQLLVFVAPYMKTSTSGLYTATKLEFNEAILSKLYPLDLPIDDNLLLGLPNLLFKDTIVTHKGGSSGATKSYSPPSETRAYGNSYNSARNGQSGQEENFLVDAEMQDDDPNTRILNYDYSSKRNVDYKSARPAYEKPDYSYKKFDYKNINREVIKPTEVTTEKPVKFASTPTLDETVWNTDDIKIDELKVGTNEEIPKDEGKMEIFKLFEEDENNDQHQLKVIPILKLSMPKQKTFTIYDSIVNLEGDESNSSEIKVDDKDKKKLVG